MPENPKIIHTRRKTIALIIERDGSLVVRAPLRVSDKAILRMIEQKKDWIRAKQAQVKARYPAYAPKEYANGEEFWYLGKTYPLEIINARSPTLSLDGSLHREGSFKLSSHGLPKAPLVFKNWYRRQAAKILPERSQWWASRHGFTYQKIRISSALTRWGSCSSKGTLSFTWRLVMAPIAVIDYVVVHELVHLQVKNHSKEFWGRVELIMPDYKQKIKWLKENGHLLRL